MAAPEIAQKSPYKIELIAGREYWWCACGRSKKQPLCDGFAQGYRIQAGAV
jgi:CDGSH-type Zn-finger protein